jgi:hypothetical protein
MGAKVPGLDFSAGLWYNMVAIHVAPPALLVVAALWCCERRRAVLYIYAKHLVINGHFAQKFRFYL